MYKDFEELLREITFQTALMFNVNDEEKLSTFHDILEINYLEEILKNKKYLEVSSTKFKHSNNYVTPAIASALVASGISIDGTLPIRTYYNIPKKIENSPELIEQALKRYNLIESNLITYDFMDRIEQFSINTIRNNDVEIEKTMTALFAVDDSYLGYLSTNMDDSIFPYVSNLLNNQLDTLERSGYKDTLCYRILRDLGDMKHRDILSKVALISMATLDYDLLSGKKLTKERIESAKKDVEIADAYNGDAIEQYVELFNDRLKVSTKVKK